MSWNYFEFIVHSMTAKCPGPEAVNSVKPQCSFHHSSQLGWGFVVGVQCQKKALSIFTKISAFVSTHNIFPKVFIQVGKHETYLSIFFYGSGFIHIVLSWTPFVFIVFLKEDKWAKMSAVCRVLLLSLGSFSPVSGMPAGFFKWFLQDAS